LNLGKIRPLGKKREHKYGPVDKIDPILYLIRPHKVGPILVIQSLEIFLSRKIPKLPRFRKHRDFYQENRIFGQKNVVFLDNYTMSKF
jgi:hypothetical protein